MKNIKDDEIAVCINPAPKAEENIKSLKNKDEYEYDKEIINIIEVNMEQVKRLL